MVDASVLVAVSVRSTDGVVVASSTGAVLLAELVSTGAMGGVEVEVAGIVGAVEGGGGSTAGTGVGSGEVEEMAVASTIR